MVHELREHARAYIEAEKGTILKQGKFQVALCYPNRYAVAMSSLGYQVVYRLFNERPDFACERAVYPDDPEALELSRIPLFTLERQRPISEFDLVAFSFAFEPDLLHFIQMLRWAGIPPLARDRDESHPPILVGGPVTLSNALPLGPFADFVAMGDGEETIPEIMNAMESAGSKKEFLKACGDLPNVWVPALHGESTPDNAKVGAHQLPAVGQIVTPHAELTNMFLVETSRGCPRMCSFCVVRATVSPMREADPQAVLDSIPDWTDRVGFVGAAVTDYSHIHTVLEGAIERRKEIGISSLRADRLDERLVTLLKEGGYQTLTVAADAPSEKQRAVIMKGIRERHLVRAAELARWAGLRLMKLYMIVGLPGEDESDLEDLIQLCKKLARIMPLAITLSPFVPKLHTPLASAPFAGVKEIDRKLKRVRQGLRGLVDVRSASARWAWIEYRLSQGAMRTGEAALLALEGGGNFSAWKHAFKDIDDPREAIALAEKSGKWAVDGVDPTQPAPPKPPKRLAWRGVKPDPSQVIELRTKFDRWKDQG